MNSRIAFAPVIGVLGGSGVYDIDGLSGKRWVKVDSPFGEPSDELLFGDLDGQRMVFLPRHGRGHRIPPSEIATWVIFPSGSSEKNRRSAGRSSFIVATCSPVIACIQASRGTCTPCRWNELETRPEQSHPQGVTPPHSYDVPSK